MGVGFYVCLFNSRSDLQYKSIVISLFWFQPRTELISLSSNKGAEPGLCRHGQDPNVIPYHLTLLPGAGHSLASKKAVPFQMGRKHGKKRIHSPLFHSPELSEYIIPSICTLSLLVLLLLLFVFLSCCCFH